MVESLPYHVVKNSWSWAWSPHIKGLAAVMELSNQKSMWNKLGRDIDLPTDTLSINYYHQFVRDGIMLQNGNPDSEFAEGIVFRLLDERLDDTTMESYVDDLFLEILGRHAKDAEKTTLVNLAKSAGWDDRFQDRSWYRYRLSKLVRDYISRLSEVYRYRRIEGAVE